MSDGLQFDVGGITKMHAEHKRTAPIVHVLTHCAHEVLAYGTLLVFPTLRTGFPTARIEVVDNGSCPEMVPRIRAAAEAAGASFEARPLVHYSEHWRHNLFARDWGEGNAPVVFVDPDVVFWESCEGWDFGDALMAGRLIPELPRSLNGLHAARLHPSLLWVPSMKHLRSEFARRLPSEAAGRWNCIGPASEQDGDIVRTYDTLAPLYRALQDACTAFDAVHLDAYDHLFLGSHLPAAVMGSPSDVLIESHRAAAQGDVASLRGLWRRQNDTFLSGTPLPARRPGEPRRKVPTVRDIRDWHSLPGSDSALNQAEYRLRARLEFAPRSGRGGPRPMAKKPAR